MRSGAGGDPGASGVLKRAAFLRSLGPVAPVRLGAKSTTFFGSAGKESEVDLEAPVRLANGLSNVDFTGKYGAQSARRSPFGQSALMRKDTRPSQRSSGTLGSGSGHSVGGFRPRISLIVSDNPM